jgi:hypothetical protein
MDALARFHAARVMAREGRHEEALRELQWFHEHALEEMPSLAGVRLSYALGAWEELGAIYPPARAALEAVRDRDTALLLAGQGSRDLFMDVNAIHRELGEEASTHALFVELEKVDRELAQSCASVALTAIIAVGDYALAERLLPEPERVVRRQASILNADFTGRRRMRFMRAPYVATSINLYVDQVRKVLTVLDGRGRRQDAARLRRLAADLIPATTIRRAVRAALLPGAPTWRERSAARLRRLPRSRRPMR